MNMRLIRPHRSILAIYYRLMDAVWVIFALWLVAFFSPYPWSEHPWTQWYSFAAACAVGLFYLSAEYNGLYVSARSMSLRQELFKIWWAWLGVVLGLLLLGFSIKVSAEYPRRVVLVWFFTVPLLLCIWRVFFGLLLRFLRQRENHLQPVAIFGVGNLGQRIAQSIIEKPWMGMRLVGFFDDYQQIGHQPFPTHTSAVIGRLTDLIARAQAGEIAAVYIALPMRAEQRIQELLDKLADTPVSAYVVPDLFVFDLLHARWVGLDGVPAVSVFETPFYGVDGSIKRIEDIILGSLFLCLSALPMLLVAAAIKATSPGPVLFKQRRYGLDGRPITVWKFRTMMVCENDDASVTQAIRNDPRVTPLGHFLRKTSLDELPQFFNVLQGSMSIVGPRPHPIALNEQHRGLIRGYMLRHKVKPGITGWAQVNGWRGETETLEKMRMRVEYDLEYIRSWSLWLDLKIIAQTVVSGFAKKNAY